MILLLSSDLMFQSKISSTVRAEGKGFVVERSAVKLVERVQEPDAVSLVLLDLTLMSVDLTQDIPLLHESFPNCKILAYGPHVDVDRLTLAEESGADTVLTRGQIDRDLVSIIQGA